MARAAWLGLRLPLINRASVCLLLALCTAEYSGGPPMRAPAQRRRQVPPGPVLWRLRLRGGAGAATDGEDGGRGTRGSAALHTFGAGADARLRSPAHRGRRGEGDWDIEDDLAKLDSEDENTEDEQDEDGSPVADGFLTQADLHELEAPIRRKAVRNPEGYYAYNRTADRWEQRKWEPLALPGEDQFTPMPANQEHPRTRTARRANESLEDFVRRAPCWPPYCRRCPLRKKASLSASALLLHERITGSKVNVTTALRCGLEPPFSPALAQGLSGFHVPRSQEEDLNGLLRVAVEDNDVAGAVALLKAGANVSEVDAYGMAALHEAAVTGHADMCKLLLDYGANWNALDQYRRTPLHWAAYFGKIATIVAIMDHDAGGGSCSPEEIEEALHRKDYVGDSPEALASYMGRTDVTSYFKVLIQRGSKSAAEFAAPAMEQEAMLAAHPVRSPIQEIIEAATVDPDTIPAEGPEPPPPGEEKEFCEYVVGPESAPVTNRVPWGPGTSIPRPWQCWFCPRDFGTLDQATAHELECSRLHGWEIDEKAAHEHAAKHPFNKCPGAKDGSHAYECIAQRVPYAWVRIKNEQEFDARQLEAGGNAWMADQEPVKWDEVDMEDLGQEHQGQEHQMEAKQVYEQMLTARKQGTEALRAETHKFVGGGWSKMARNTRKRQELRAAKHRTPSRADTDTDRDRDSATQMPEGAGIETGMGGGGGEGLGALGMDSCLSESEQFPPHRAPLLEKILQATHRVLSFNFSSVANGSIPVGVPTAFALEQLPEYLRDPENHFHYSIGEEVTIPLYFTTLQGTPQGTPRKWDKTTCAIPSANRYLFDTRYLYFTTGTAPRNASSHFPLFTTLLFYR